MTDLFDNPMGLDGFEFVEFSAPERGVLEPVFQMMGFTHVANHRTKDVVLYRQGDINFIINYERDSYAYYFAHFTPLIISGWNRHSFPGTQLNLSFQSTQTLLPSPPAA